MRDVVLPSGAKLTVIPAPFADSKGLYQAILRTLGETQISTKMEIQSMVKDLFCNAFSSKEIDGLLAECMKKCLYNGQRITADTFEPIEAREDYVKVCAEVGYDNVFPFLKSLLSEFGKAVKTAENIPTSTQKTTS